MKGGALDLLARPATNSPAKQAATATQPAARGMPGFDDVSKALGTQTLGSLAPEIVRALQAGRLDAGINATVQRILADGGLSSAGRVDWSAATRMLQSAQAASHFRNILAEIAKNAGGGR